MFLILLSSCGSDSKSTTTTSTTYPRKPTNSEAQLFSEIFVNNFSDANANYLALAGTLPANGFIARGVADWENNTFSTYVALTKEGEVDITSIVSNEVVYETYVDIEKGFNDHNLENKDWVVRQFDPNTYGNDALLKAISVLANETPENPLLLAQNGVEVLGTEKVNDLETTVFKGMDSRIYFVSDDGRMQRLIGKLSGFSRELTITFYNRGADETFTVPKENQVHNINLVESWYFQLRPNF